MNNEEFWQEYLKQVKDKLKDLCSKKNQLQIDLHIHSNYSADGKDHIKDIINTTKNLGFDVISITDHDTLKAYDEIYNYVKDGLTNPIIVPGIEFTIDNVSYQSQCHILQLFVNPKEKSIQNNVKINEQAMFKRSKIQFKRLNENKAIKEILKKYNLEISYEEYLNYINKNNLICEYDTLCEYLISKFKPQHITNYEILDLLEKYNKLDIYIDRRMYKEKRYAKLREKYIVSKENDYSVRFLLSMLAVREVDDDWWPGPSSGSISVNSYGQIKVEELNKTYNAYFAHPTESKLDVVRTIIENNPNIIGLELNTRNNYNDINNFYKLLKEQKLLLTIGSDSHDCSLKFYKDLDFYKINSEDFLKLIK